LGDCFNEPGIVGIVAKGLAETINRLVEAAFEVDLSVRPEPQTKLVAGDDLPGAFDQRRQDLERLLRQLDSQALLEEFAAGNVDFKDSKADDSPTRFRRWDLSQVERF
jgi:hypothetical protein